ncbi:TetR/AcrR family transcriptional regulator [Amycolatopsis sp. SID8362]|uniref:TetR/AcrR family transcriptional regulator n=1 Tax=Amycolatopsis sp. SID8362 TaxID=2690346 RepID=UPI0013680F99|nr:TetR/AcrR family transcriptional regulator [Amycolatopsis sp. SID8362]NBH03615.1 TetR family transcriptional regulator [Amycolatopsis sp. SID8362]NED40316.1 TetR/AcrR family transcriptional regulator [Amycolatopsis sp. SID8362]
MTAVDVDTRRHRQRLLDGLAESITETGFRDTTVADVVRRARTSRRTFYEHFASREECLIALLADANRAMIEQISDAVDPGAPWALQVRQAIESWIACAESEPAITLSWIRDVPALGAAARDLQRDAMEGFIAMTQRLTDTPSLRAAGISPPSRQVAIILLGGLRELIATTVEDGGSAGDVTEVAVRASIALLGPG